VAPTDLLSGKALQPKDRHISAARTQFVPDALLGFFDLAAWPSAPTEPVGVPLPKHGLHLDIGARMRGMWR